MGCDVSDFMLFAPRSPQPEKKKHKHKRVHPDTNNAPLVTGLLSPGVGALNTFITALDTNGSLSFCVAISRRGLNRNV